MPKRSMLIRSWLRLLWLLPLAASAYAHAPSFNILGSYFPAWMLCVLVAILLVALLHVAVRRAGVEDYFEPGIVTYPCLAAFFSFSLWLIFFS